MPEDNVHYLFERDIPLPRHGHPMMPLELVDVKIFPSNRLAEVTDFDGNPKGIITEWNTPEGLEVYTFLPDSERAQDGVAVFQYISKVEEQAKAWAELAPSEAEELEQAYAGLALDEIGGLFGELMRSKRLGRDYKRILRR